MEHSYSFLVYYWNGLEGKKLNKSYMTATAYVHVVYYWGTHVYTTQNVEHFLSVLLPLAFPTIYVSDGALLCGTAEPRFTDTR